MGRLSFDEAQNHWNENTTALAVDSYRSIGIDRSQTCNFRPSIQAHTTLISAHQNFVDQYVDEKGNVASLQSGTGARRAPSRCARGHRRVRSCEFGRSLPGVALYTRVWLHSGWIYPRRNGATAGRERFWHPPCFFPARHPVERSRLFVSTRLDYVAFVVFVLICVRLWGAVHGRGLKPWGSIRSTIVPRLTIARSRVSVGWLRRAPCRRLP